MGLLRESSESSAEVLPANLAAATVYAARLECCDRELERLAISEEAGDVKNPGSFPEYLKNQIVTRRIMREWQFAVDNEQAFEKKEKFETADVVKYLRLLRSTPSVEAERDAILLHAFLRENLGEAYAECHLPEFSPTTNVLKELEVNTVCIQLLPYSARSVEVFFVGRGLEHKAVVEEEADEPEAPKKNSKKNPPASERKPTTIINRCILRTNDIAMALVKGSAKVDPWPRLAEAFGRGPTVEKPIGYEITHDLLDELREFLGFEGKEIRGGFAQSETLYDLFRALWPDNETPYVES